MMDFEVQIAHSVSEIGQDSWDRLSAGRPLSSYRWYRFAETVHADCQFVYVTLLLAARPLARATFQLTWEEGLEFFPRIAWPLAGALLRRRRLLTCHSPLASCSGLILPDPPLRDAALQTITRVAQEQARQHKVSFITFGYLEQQQTQWAGWPAYFSAISLADPGTRLEIIWPDFDSYLQSLSRKKRKHYRQDIKRAQEMGVEIKIYPAVIDIDKALALVLAREQKYNSLSFSWNRRILENATMVDCAWLTAEVDNRIIGCELLLGDGGFWHVVLLGRDYGFPNIYFLLGYADIRWAIEHGAKVLRWGSTAYDVKRRLGFQLETDTYVFFDGSGPVFGALGRLLARFERQTAQEQTEQFAGSFGDDG